MNGSHELKESPNSAPAVRTSTGMKKERRSRFGKLCTIRELEKTANYQRKFLCRCDCGTVKKVLLHNLVNGSTTSCGCARFDNRNNRGYGYHPLYFVWKNMLDRCHNKNSKFYAYYGGRGIRVCEDWQEKAVKFVLWAEKAGYEQGLELDRKDNDKGYYPDNCRFVTHLVNMQNTRLIQANNTSGFRGVSKSRNSFFVHITTKAFSCREYGFKTAIGAAIRRDQICRDNKLNIKLNFEENHADGTKDS